MVILNLSEITCQAACHGKTEHGIFVKFKKTEQTFLQNRAKIFAPGGSVMVILNLSESFAKPLVMAKLNMAYLSSLKNRAKLPHCRCQKTEQNCCCPH